MLELIQHTRAFHPLLFDGRPLDSLSCCEDRELGLDFGG